MAQIQINNNLLVAQSIPNGYTWTLASRLGDMLHMTEKLFGPRDKSYTILGTEFVEHDPQIWFPGDHKHIIIQLNPEAAKDNLQACYQLAHETIHLLAPVGVNDINNLEEGVADYFASYYLKTQLNAHDWQPNHPSYKRVFDLVKPLLDKDISRIRQIREQEPSFSKMTYEQVETEFPELDPEEIKFLIAKFIRDA